MKANVGGIDKVLRIVVGLGVLSLLFLLEGPARWWGPVGLVPLLTGLMGWCPAYTLIGFNTCPAKQQSGARAVPWRTEPGRGRAFFSRPGPAQAGYHDPHRNRARALTTAGRRSPGRRS